MRRYHKKLTPKHQNFVNQYVLSRHNPLGIYKKAYFCEDEEIAIVIHIEDYEEQPSSWGCVNMQHQLLVPFQYERIFDYGRFLIAINNKGRFLYNKKGQMLYEIGNIIKTSHRAYNLIFDPQNELFRIVIRKMAISKEQYVFFHSMPNGLVFSKRKDGKVGAILFSKLKLPFKYYAIAVPQNGYTLGVIENGEAEDGETLYKCQLIKVRNHIKKDDSIHPTGINLFSCLRKDEVEDFFKNKERVANECNKIVCYNEHVCFSIEDFKLFPFETDNLPGEPDYQEEEEEETDRNNMSLHDYLHQWDEYADIAYEGYSRLYLGLDD